MTPFLAMPFPCLAPALRLARLGSCDGHVLSAEGMPPDGISPAAAVFLGTASQIQDPSLNVPKTQSARNQGS
jgi:hypothetical protein